MTTLEESSSSIYRFRTLAARGILWVTALSVYYFIKFLLSIYHVPVTAAGCRTRMVSRMTQTKPFHCVQSPELYLNQYCFSNDSIHILPNRWYWWALSHCWIAQTDSSSRVPSFSGLWEILAEEQMASLMVITRNRSSLCSSGAFLVLPYGLFSTIATKTCSFSLLFYFWFYFVSFMCLYDLFKHLLYT